MKAKVETTVPITAEIAQVLEHGTRVYHFQRCGHDGHALKARVSGRYKVTRTGWRLAIQWGLYNRSQITDVNAHEWRVATRQVVCPVS